MICDAAFHVLEIRTRNYDEFYSVDTFLYNMMAGVVINVYNIKIHILFEFKSNLSNSFVLFVTHGGV